MFLHQIKKILIIAPSGPVESDRLKEGIAYLEAAGKEVEVAKNVYQNYEGYLAGSDEDRLYELDRAFASDADLLIAARGGYGSALLLDHAKLEKWASCNKPLCGYSDLTALQLALYQFMYCRNHRLADDMVQPCIFSTRNFTEGYMPLQGLEPGTLEDSFSEFLARLIRDMLDPTQPFQHRSESKYTTI